MKPDWMLLKQGAFWAIVIIAWIGLATVAHSRVFSVIVWIAWVVFLCILFTRIWPRKKSD